MRYRWLNLLLRLSNRIYRQKQELIGREGLSVVWAILTLTFLELILGVVSLPLYLSLRSKNVVAFFEDQGEYAKVAFDYKLRRILTLTGVGAVLAVWVVKLLLITLVPAVFGPLQLYSVTDLRPPELMSDQQLLIEEELSIQTANVVQSLQVPELLEVDKQDGKNYVFGGVGEPGTSIVMLITDIQTAVYTGEVDEEGNWKIEHSQAEFLLNEGNHLVTAFTFDEIAGVRSNFSSEQYFKIETTWADSLLKNLDTIANWAVIAIVAIAAFLIFLTI